MRGSFQSQGAVVLLSWILIGWAVPVQASDAGAPVTGLWCGEGLLREASLELVQHRQEFDGTLMHRQRSRHVEGSVEGNTLRTMGGKAGELVLQLEQERLRIVTAGGPLALAQGMGFARTVGGRCS